MIYVYRRASSTGARSLVDGLMDAGVPAKRWNDVRPRTPRQGDIIICWGEVRPQNLPDGVKVLNGAAIHSKYQDAIKLKEAGIATVEVNLVRPPARPAGPDPALAAFQEVRVQVEEFDDARFARNPVFLDAVRQARESFDALLRSLEQPAPVAVAETWLGRRNNHVGGADLLAGLQQADYFVKKEEIVEEFRIHSFCGKSIRAGKKVPREGFANPHAWIRSYDGGWKIQYDAFESRREMRDLAAGAVKALGLDFGAVDLARTADGRLLVLEVNRAPGLEGGTVEAYVSAIPRWIRGEFQQAERAA